MIRAFVLSRIDGNAPVSSNLTAFWMIRETTFYNFEAAFINNRASETRFFAGKPFPRNNFDSKLLFTPKTLGERSNFIFVNL